MKQRRRLRPDDVENLVEALGLVVQAISSARLQLLCAMDRVNYETGRKPMNYLYDAQSSVVYARSLIADMLPPDVLPVADMAPGLVDIWLRQQREKREVEPPQRHEEEEADD